MILSELTDIGDETFTEDSLISKLTNTLPEGYDAFLTAWDSTPTEDRTFANLQLRLYKEEAWLKRRIHAEVTSDTSAYYSHRSSPGVQHNTHPPHLRTPSSGSSSQYGNSRTGNRGYQPTDRSTQLVSLILQGALLMETDRLHIILLSTALKLHIAHWNSKH